MVISIRLDTKAETAPRRRLEVERIPLSAVVREAIQAQSGKRASRPAGMRG